jgi:HEAT repeat protein
MAETFSKRYGLVKPSARLVRDDAPKELRRALPAVFQRQRYGAEFVGKSICHLKRLIPETQLGYDPAWNVVQLLMDRLQWNEVYDLVELLCPYPEESQYSSFTADVNELFEEQGIGWKLVDGLVFERGDETHERLVQEAVEALTKTGLPTATKELKEALAALSQRPEPDTRGAVIRAIGAVEALARDVTKNPNATLGALANQLPSPLNQVVGKLWGYVSEQGRHVREGQSIGLREAYLVVNLCATFVSHLCSLGGPLMPP